MIDMIVWLFVYSFVLHILFYNINKVLHPESCQVLLVSEAEIVIKVSAVQAMTKIDQFWMPQWDENVNFWLDYFFTVNLKVYLKKTK